jgi:phage repressor protein C with HTH and peptisase S24 domain
MPEIKEMFSSGFNFILKNHFHGKQKDIAIELDMSPSSLNDYLKGRREGDEGTRRKITNLLGFKYEGVLELGRKIIETPEDDQDTDSDIDEVSFDELLESISLDENVPLPGFVLIPKYKARLSGGHGSFEDSDQVECNFAFRRDWINRRGTDSFALFEVIGESMAPFICEGDVVLVDLADKDPDMIVDGKTYAIREDGTVKIKRLVRQGKKLIIRSRDISNYPDYEAEDDFSLLGRVIWFGHVVK